MERTFKYKIERFLQGKFILIKKAFKIDKRPKFPKYATNDELTASIIFLRVLKNPDSKIYYDLRTNECYVRSGDSTLYLFLESRNLKVINSVYGYDIRLSAKMEVYLADRFIIEMSKRRSAFKNEALSKVTHSLDKTLKDINEKY
jgi:hypothetical protein